MLSVVIAGRCCYTVAAFATARMARNVQHTMPCACFHKKWSIQIWRKEHKQTIQIVMQIDWHSLSLPLSLAHTHTHIDWELRYNDRQFGAVLAAHFVRTNPLSACRCCWLFSLTCDCSPLDRFWNRKSKPKPLSTPALCVHENSVAGWNKKRKRWK